MLGRVLRILPVALMCVVPAQAASIVSFPQLTLVTNPANTLLAELVPWGSTYTLGQQYTQSGSYQSGAFPKQLSFQWNWPLPTGSNTIASGCSGVCTYNYFSYGDYLGHYLSPVPPLELGRIHAFMSTSSVTYTGQLAGYSVLYDTYETTIPHGGTADRALEMEVYLHVSDNAKPWLAKLPVHLPDFTDANGIVWHVAEHETKNMSPNNFPDVLFWRADGADMQGGTFHLLAMLRYVASYGYGSESFYLNGTSLGVEVAYGQGKLSYNSFTGLLE